MGDTTIQWTDKTWNPVSGCTKVSAGCANCYAERLFPRAYGKDRKFTDVRFHPERLEQPLRWRKPRRVFVNSMSDLFHESLSTKDVDPVFSVMGLAHRHTFQVLTKRPDLMRNYLTHPDTRRRLLDFSVELASSIRGVELKIRFEDDGLEGVQFPNVWLGVSVEDQATANERIPLLLATPAAVRWVSYEPALGPVDLEQIEVRLCAKDAPIQPLLSRTEAILPLRGERIHGRIGYEHPCLGWVVIGGESGPKARPMELEWARSVIEQCKGAGVPAFMKQLGSQAWLLDPKGGDPSEWPEDLRVREFPEPAKELEAV